MSVEGKALGIGPRLRSLLLVGGAIAVLGTSQAAFAQEATPTPDPAKLDVGSDIVVTARRRAERLQDVPVAVAVIDRREIRQYDLTNIANVKLVAPQVTFDRAFTGSGSSISLRGVSSSNLDAGLEQSVLIDFDGMPISRGRLLSDALFDIAGIDVLKGPQSLFFGKNTPGGVVSIHSALPTKEFSGFARTGYEFNAGAASFEGAISGTIAKGLTARLAVYGLESKGYITNTSNGIVDPQRAALPYDAGGSFIPAAPHRLGAEQKGAIRLTLRYENGGNFDATFRILGSYAGSQGQQALTEIIACPAGQSVPTVVGMADPNGNCRLDLHSATGFLPPAELAAWPEVRGWNQGEPSGRNATVFPSLNMNYRIGGVTLTSQTGLYDYDYRSAGSADGTSYAYYWSYQREKNTSFVQEVRASSSFGGMIDFAAGGYYSHDNRTLYQGARNGPNPADPVTGRYESNDSVIRNTSDAYSLFGQLIFRPIPTIELAGGARYTHEVKTIDLRTIFVNPVLVNSFLPVNVPIAGRRPESRTSPEATITWRPNTDLTLFVAYKTGYLSGGFSNPGTPARNLTLPLITYDAERAQGFEGGIKFSMLGRRLTGSLIGYRYNYKGLQLTSLNATLAQPAYQTTNAADTRVQGIELEGRFNIAPGFALRGSISYNHARFVDFPNAQCYAGQTAAQGCQSVTIGSTTTTAQNLAGSAIYRAPDWLVTAGAVYDTRLNNKLHLGLNADIRNTSGYFVSVTENPLSYQKGFTLLNAGLRVGDIDDHWSIALIGRNITNRIYATIGTDQPGGGGSVYGAAGEPRAVLLQFETRF